ncbi:MAG: hypothetical protein A2W90_13030 [Bacteroidetes bacterium GWF2_42_66]|nr:MAG: hypothetical protein A2W89_18020 [Bacteroidetes bacterium GWE2_42_39]OFY40286.1 MAG: hypothetical protein A2W90_13030 [Bacteroidetes bacterium GWF2_42_66]HBL73733.1 hypothetical protein [Prolixibacteraceae bacterium]HCU61454.1 hypothetical protein [Prolixibacteraceae bacterium]
MGITAASAATVISNKAEVVKTMDNDKKEKAAKSEAKSGDKKSCESKKCCSEKKEACSDKK